MQPRVQPQGQQWQEQELELASEQEKQGEAECGEQERGVCAVARAQLATAWV